MTSPTHAPESTHADAPPVPAAERGIGEWGTQLLPHIIRAEANLLRLPLFALDTKRLKSLDGIECAGRITRGGQTHQFSFRATRNTATLYPGPLSRAAHLAFLSILTDRGFPFENPITWTWRDLCRRMHIAYGGLIVRRLKTAIEATAGLLIRSEFALYSKEHAHPICTRNDALHLYERVSFIGSQLPDGSIADQNQLWLSDWYLSNLQAMFTAPLDYALWRRLDEKSPIASRLYEFLLLNFYSGSPVLRINYATLARFLPVRPERYRSDAERQFKRAFELLELTKVISSAVWGDSKEGLAQLSIYRGELLTSAPNKEQGMLPFADDDFVTPIEVKELRHLKPPEWDLITSFYQLWSADGKARPSPKELSHAAELIAAYGVTKAKAIIPVAIKMMKAKFPDAKTFGALMKYAPDAAKEYDRHQRVADSRKQDRRAEVQIQLDELRKKAEEAKLRSLWKALSPEDQHGIRQDVIARNPKMRLERYPSLLESACLTELARRRTGSNA